MYQLLITNKIECIHAAKYNYVVYSYLCVCVCVSEYPSVQIYLCSLTDLCVAFVAGDECSCMCS